MIMASLKYQGFGEGGKIPLSGQIKTNKNIVSV
jgi:hypothetical protein